MADETQEPEAGGASATTPSEVPPSSWAIGSRLLLELLDRNQGCVSSFALRRALEDAGVPDSRGVAVRLRYFDFDEPDELPKPDRRWFAHARSFYTEEAFERLRRVQEEQATRAETADTVKEVDEEDDIKPRNERRQARQEEARLGTYVVGALENIYQSDYAPTESPYAFDVHSERPGSEFENVDAIAVHWRSERIAEIVSVEVKLDFTARLLQQARNYSRFSDRVWVAVPVLADVADVAEALRDYDPLLFEHVLEVGLGILACRRRPGRSYEIVPVQWPRRNHPDAVEREQFLERYRSSFEAAGVLAPRTRTRYPVF